MRDAIPLKEDDKRQLFAKFTTVIRATVKGNVACRLRRARHRPGRQRAAPDPRRQGHQAADYVVLISTIGGLALFGVNGFVIGPVIAAMFIAVWGIFAAANEAEAEPAPPTVRKD